MYVCVMSWLGHGVLRMRRGFPMKRTYGKTMYVHKHARTYRFRIFMFRFSASDKFTAMSRRVSANGIDVGKVVITFAMIQGDRRTR